MNFIATPADLRAVFGRVEAKHPLHYARMGAFSFPETPVYSALADVPDLDREDACFFLLPPGAQPGRWQPELARGGPWYYVDGHSEQNRSWPVLKPSVIAEEDVLEEGWYYFDDRRPDQKPLQTVVEKEVRASLTRRGSVWIGPEAVAWLMAGKVRFAEEDEDGDQRKTPKKYHPCKLGALLPAGRIDPSWRTADVRRLARQVKEAGEAEVLAVLADALEDAGCADERILGHCRWAGKHQKGCWLPGMILGEG